MRDADYDWENDEEENDEEPIGDEGDGGYHDPNYDPATDPYAFMREFEEPISDEGGGGYHDPNYDPATDPYADMREFEEPISDEGGGGYHDPNYNPATDPYADMREFEQVPYSPFSTRPLTFEEGNYSVAPQLDPMTNATERQRRKVLAENAGGLRRPWNTRDTPDYIGLGGETERGAERMQNRGSTAGDTVQQYNNAVARAREEARRDRDQALTATTEWQKLIKSRLGTNPFGKEYQAQTLGIIRDARARQYGAAVEELRQAYAQQGKPLDPRLLTLLRMQMEREANGDIRNLSVDTAGRGFAADLSYTQQIGNTVSQLDRILSNTQRMPDPRELSFLMSLSRNSEG